MTGYSEHYGGSRWMSLVHDDPEYDNRLSADANAYYQAQVQAQHRAYMQYSQYSHNHTVPRLTNPSLQAHWSKGDEDEYMDLDHEQDETNGYNHQHHQHHQQMEEYNQQHPEEYPEQNMRPPPVRRIPIPLPQFDLRPFEDFGPLEEDSPEIPRRIFVRGFFSGLRRLPKVLTRRSSLKKKKDKNLPVKVKYGEESEEDGSPILGADLEQDNTLPLYTEDPGPNIGWRQAVYEEAPQTPPPMRAEYNWGQNLGPSLSRNQSRRVLSIHVTPPSDIDEADENEITPELPYQIPHQMPGSMVDHDHNPIPIPPTMHEEPESPDPESPEPAPVPMPFPMPGGNTVTVYCLPGEEWYREPSPPPPTPPPIGPPVIPPLPVTPLPPSTRSNSQSTLPSRTQASQAGLERNEREVREEVRRREEEWRQREREATRKEQDARRREEDARRKEERLKRKEEEARRKEEEFILKQKEAERQAEELQLKQQEVRRQEEEMKRREEELRRREEELQRRENEIAARQQADLRKREEADCREGVTYHPEEQVQEPREGEDPKVQEKETSSRKSEDTGQLTTELQVQFLMEAKAVQHRDTERGKANEIWAQKQIEQATGKQRSPKGYQSRILYSTHTWNTHRPSVFSVETSVSSYQSSFDWQGDGGMTDWQHRQEELYREQQEQFRKERERLDS